ncbi:MAG: methyltransferase domain-containing protein [Abditibacteriaceae bacterium]
MNARLVNFLADPNDGGDLRLHIFEGDENAVRVGVLINPQSGRWYPIKDAIPSLFADALREEDAVFIATFGTALNAALQQEGCAGISKKDASPEGEADLQRINTERTARDEQAEDYDRMLAIKMLDVFERPVYRRVMAKVHSGLVLEAGAGTGRFTSLFAESAGELISVDMSRDSLLRNRARHVGKTACTVHWIQADLTHLPLKDGIFGAIAHVGVYEHIPSRDLRQQFLKHAKRVMADEGTLLLSAYRYNGLTKYFEKEGEHDGGIPFFRFTEEELRGEVEPYFAIQHFRENLGIYMSMIVAKKL